RVLRATRLHLGPDVATPPYRPGARLDPMGLTMRLGKNDNYYYTSSVCFTLQVSRVVAARMDKCSANNVDNGNVHKAGMVMNGLPISVYVSETLG
ncbi:hypothetical protein ACJX0J_022525, partial [Zea mays]